MKQLIIVNSAKALNAKADNAGANVTPENLSNLAEGAITFFELGADSVLAAAPTKNFAVALGKGANKTAFVFPEIDVNTLKVTKTLPAQGKKFKVVFTAPSATVKKEYTLIFVKKGTVPNERSKFTISVVAKTTTAGDLATAIANAVNSKANALFNMKATVSTAQVTIECNNLGENWTVLAADSLDGTTLTITKAEKEIGGKDYILDLASQCAAGKGFNYTAENAQELYPGYPEVVENLVPNAASGSSTAGYAIYNLHFATGRDFGKQMDERVWQTLHIAVPVNNASISTIDTILGQPVLVNEAD